MKIGLASDSHGNLDGLGRAFDGMLALGAERIFFLGGGWADVDRLVERRRVGAPAGSGDLEFLRAVEGALSAGARPHPDADALARAVVRVASRGCPEYELDGSARKLMELVDGHICCLVHDKAELSRDDISNATVLFHGNAGQAKLVQIGPRYFVTPGHLRPASGSGGPPTFALVDLDDQKLELSVHALDGAVVWRERAGIGPRNRMSVK